jgi:hypothetical protein
MAIDDLTGKAREALIAAARKALIPPRPLRP